MLIAACSLLLVAYQDSAIILAVVGWLKNSVALSEVFDSFYTIPCTDTDTTQSFPNGENPYTKGTVTGKADPSWAAEYKQKTRTYTDKCYAAWPEKGYKNLLIEGYCPENGLVGTKNVNCPNGCQNGACAPVPVQSCAFIFGGAWSVYENPKYCTPNPKKITSNPDDATECIWYEANNCKGYEPGCQIPPLDGIARQDLCAINKCKAGQRMLEKGSPKYAWSYFEVCMS